MLHTYLIQFALCNNCCRQPNKQYRNIELAAIQGKGSKKCTSNEKYKAYINFIAKNFSY